MKMVKYYVLGAIAAVGLAWLIPFWFIKAPLVWIAFSLLAVSSAYLFNYPSLFRKREDGSIPFYIRWLFIPFLLGSGSYNSWARKNDKVPAIQQIDENLFLACRLFGSDVDTLLDYDVQAILDVTAEFDGLDWSAYQSDCTYLNVPVLDHTSPTMEQLNTAINWIDQQIDAGRKVVVHCALGRGRSVLIVAAYLLAKDDTLSVKDALNKIKSVRDTARLNKRQLASLTKVKQGGRLALNKTLTLVANPVAGGGKWQTYSDDILSQLNPHFRVDVMETTPDIDATMLTKKALHKNSDIIVACGGDGTIAEVAHALIGSSRQLGIIPMGTANALSQVLHGFSSKITPINTACDLLIKGYSHDIDTARCNGELMLLVAAVGFEQKMIERADREEKDEGGQFAYLRGLWEAMSTNETLTMDISLDGAEKEQLETPSLVIANAAPVTTALAQGSTEPSVVDGKLDITWLTPKSSADEQFLSLAELVFLTPDGKKQSERIRHTQASTIEIHFSKKRAYAIDGELREAETLLIETLPRSLSVITLENGDAITRD
ncbi:diacylglycerol kinase family protein [Alteromonas halophila]|uniref:Diacylglycerol kinase catalytic subunit n=1 Tax=Alteromonas halophila TaxID=516698 RepID=A0A918JL95_9ALTE|nr:diacylglycerol kinase family protein [Alteromonas halophila]GGW87680.1 diacylglycerol kinase catalytic subunit [Alteromonas halophila]